MEDVPPLPAPAPNWNGSGESSQLEDVSNCEAFKVCRDRWLSALQVAKSASVTATLLSSAQLKQQVLDGLVESFGISTERADAAKSRYFKLHKQVVDNMSNEKKLLDQARHLKRRLDVSSFTCHTLRLYACTQMHRHKRVHTYTQTHTHTHTHTHTLTHSRTHAHTRTHTHTHTHTRTHMHTYLRTHIHTHTNTHTHTLAHTHTHIHKCTHTHIHACTRVLECSYRFLYNAKKHSKT